MTVRTHPSYVLRSCLFALHEGGWKVNRFAQNIQPVSLGGKSYKTLIQARQDENSDRYWCGVRVTKLQAVERWLLWVKDQKHCYWIDAKWFLRIYHECVSDGSVRYAKDLNGWSVYFHFDDDTLSPSGSKGYRHDISRYRYSVDAKQKSLA